MMLASEQTTETSGLSVPGRSGRASSAVAVERKCLVTRALLPKEQMIRFAVDPSGTVVPDVAANLPGRGLWLTARRDIVAAACARKLFARAARAPVVAPDDLVDRVERLLLERAVNCLGLARRAGQAAIGFEVVREWLRGDRAAILVTAADAAADGARKLRALGPGLPRVESIDSAELGRAFGRESVVHAALAPGRLAESLLRESARLAGFRAGGVDAAVGGIGANKKV